MADILVICDSWRPHEAPLRGPATNRLYLWKRQGHGIVLCLVDERDVKGILKDRRFRLASAKEYRLWLS